METDDYAIKELFSRWSARVAAVSAKMPKCQSAKAPKRQSAKTPVLLTRPLGANGKGVIVLLPLKQRSLSGGHKTRWDRRSFSPASPAGEEKKVLLIIIMIIMMIITVRRPERPRRQRNFWQTFAFLDPVFLNGTGSSTKSEFAPAAQGVSEIEATFFFFLLFWTFSKLSQRRIWTDFRQ